MSLKDRLAAILASEDDEQTKLASIEAAAAADDDEDENENEDEAEDSEDDTGASSEEDDDNDDEEEEDDDEENASASAGIKTAKVILNLPEAKGRESLARELAFEPGITAKRAKRLLSASPVKSSLDQQMSQVGDPDIGQDSSSGAGASDTDKAVDFVFGSHKAATGR